MAATSQFCFKRSGWPHLTLMSVVLCPGTLLLFQDCYDFAAVESSYNSSALLVLSIYLDFFFHFVTLFAISEITRPLQQNILFSTV